MLHSLLPYFEPIKYAVIIFPVIAFLFTLPFMIYNYRKYGSIPVIRVLVVYSFILYLLCSFFLVILPLPQRSVVAASPAVEPGLRPFIDLLEGLKKYNVINNLDSMSHWRAYFKSSDFFQIFANIMMFVPLGVYLRYYFKFSFVKTFVAGFVLTAFFELTQYTGIYGIYAHAYRYACVDDLINNTLGALIGFVIAPLLTFFLPTRDALDSYSLSKGSKVSPLRRMVALLIDGALLVLIIFGIDKFNYIGIVNAAFNKNYLISIAFIVFTYFTVLQVMLRGKTIGKAILRFKVAKDDGSNISLKEAFIRFIYLGVLLPAFMIIELMAILLMIVGLYYMQTNGHIISMSLICIGTIVLLLSFVYIVSFVSKHYRLPHEQRSHTKIISTIKEQSL